MADLDYEQMIQALDVELTTLRSLVLVLVEQLITADTTLKRDLVEGFAGAAQTFLSDEQLARQGSRAVLMQLAFDKLSNSLGSL